MSSTTNAENAAAPPVCINQIEGGDLGDLQNSVNLYRGEVNMPLTLLSLPGRGGLEVVVTASYSSNVNKQVSTWNLEQPTGVLGVGWQLLTSKIVVDFKDTPSFENGTYYLIMDGANYELKKVGVEGGAYIFQTKAFNFSTILYYPNYRKWIVTDENGTVYTFGGDAYENDGHTLTSGSGLCNFGVAWGNWIGSSTKNPTKMFVNQWNLGTIENIWGEQITYTYQADNIPIGNPSQNMKYTRASRISQITDVNDCQVTFSYQDKDASEIQFPADTDSSKDNAFQFLYETKYLTSILVRDKENEILSIVTLNSHKANYSENSTDGNFDKRYLDSVQVVNDQGVAKPALTFSYFENATDANPGGLAQINYPEGSVANYSYQALPLVDPSDKNGQNVNISKTINAPSGYGHPMVAYGPDYVCIVWQHNSSPTSIKLQVYTWLGNWIMYEKDFSNVSLDDDDNSKIDHIDLIRQQDFFALVLSQQYASESEREHVHLFHKNIYQPGQWCYEEASTNTDNIDLGVALGKDFVAITEQYLDDSHKEIRAAAFLWDKINKTWSKETSVFSDLTGKHAHHFTIAAKDNFFVILYRHDDDDDMKIWIYYQDQEDNWMASPSNNTQVGGTDGEILWDKMDEKKMLAVGSTFLACTYVYDDDDDKLEHKGFIINWADDFVILPRQESFDFDMIDAEEEGNSHGNNYQPPFIEGAIVGAGSRVYRFDGEDWSKPAKLTPDGKYFNAFGSDCALFGNEDDEFYADMQYDPYTNAWKPYEIINLDNNKEVEDFGTPTIRGKFRTVGLSLQYQNSDLSWSEVYTLNSDLQASSTRNLAPAFIAAAEEDEDSRMYFLKNGGVPNYMDGGTAEPMVTRFENEGLYAGFNFFITFDNSNDQTLSDATTLQLNCITSDADLLVGPQAIVVNRMVINRDATSTANDFYTEYEYDKNYASYDPYGRVAQFTQVTTLHYGLTWTAFKTVSQFFAGLPSGQAGITYPTDDAYSNVNQFYGLMAGQLYKTTDYNSDNIVVHETTNYYTAFEPASAYSAYVRLMKTVETIDAVTKTIEYVYNSRGQLQNEILNNINSSGETIKQETITTYGWEAAYPGMLDSNILELIVEKRTQATNLSVANSQPVITNIGINTYANDWNSSGIGKEWAPQKTYVWTGQGDSTFDFAAAAGTNEPNANDWLKVTEYLDYTEKGQQQLVMDVDGLKTNLVFDKDGRFPIAEFSNSDDTESIYCGFEPYEDSFGIWDGLTYDNLTREEVFTGSQSLQLSYGASVTHVFDPSNKDQVFMIGFWVKTAENFTSSTNAKINITDGVGGTVDIAIEPTNQAWIYKYAKIDGLSDSNLWSIQIINNSGGAMYIDNIFCCPALGASTAVVLESKYLLQTASLGRRGEVSRIGYNNFQEPTVETDVFGEVTQTTARSLWKSGTSFSNTKFNNDTAVKMRSNTSLCEFKDSDSWLNLWNPSSTVASNGWAINADAQQLVANNPSQVNQTLQFNRSNQDVIDSKFALRFQLGEISDSAYQQNGFSIQFGDCHLNYSCSSGTWSFTSSSLGSLTNFSTPLFSDYLLVIQDKSLHFYGDGQLLLSHFFSSTIIQNDKSIVLGTTNTRFVLDYLITGHIAAVAMNYQDGIGNSVQEQVLYDEGCVIKEKVYDPAAQEIATTKPVLYSNIGFAYQASLVTGISSTTGAMSGDINNYYPQDRGYPFTGKQYEASELARVVKVGMPGAEFAMAGTDAHPINIDYSSEASWLGLSDGEYITAKMTNPDGLTSVQIKDKLENVVGIVQGLSSATGAPAPAITKNIYNMDGNLIKIIYPNAFSQGIPSDDTTDCIRTMSYDFFGRLISQSSSDSSGTYQAAYDNAGRLRFKNEPNGYTRYYCYNVVGCLQEEGITHLDWNTLVANATNPNYYPSDKSNITQYSYGLLGLASINDLGRLIDINPGHTNHELHYHDLKGRIIEKNIAANDASHFKYQYGLNDEIISIMDGGTNGVEYLAEYVYDLHDQVKTASLTSNGKTSTVELTYNYGGGLMTRSFDGVVEENISYNSCGWINEISNNFFSEMLNYTSGGYQGAGYYSGKIAKVTTDYSAGINDSTNQFFTQYNYQFQYDNRGQLLTAQMTNSQAHAGCNIGVSANTIYDLNGNATNWNYGGNQTNVLVPNSNQIQTSNSSAYTHSNNGQVLSTPDLESITWTDSNGKPWNQPIKINKGGSNTNFQYNSQNFRTYKSSSSIDATYGLGINNMVLSQSTDFYGVPGQSSELKHYLWGPQGLLLVCKAKENDQIVANPFYYILKDHLKSVRLVVAQNGLTVAAAYNYMAFGKQVGSIYGDDSICPFRYTGQEYDSETGMYNFRNRMYNPESARFLSIDPQLQFASPYIYSGNDPVLFSDFTGQWSTGAKIGMAIGGITLAIGAAVVVGGAIYFSGGIGAVVTLGIGGALVTAGIAGMTYSKANQDDFKAGKFVAHMVVGGIVGGVTSFVGGAITEFGFNIAIKVGLNVVVGAVGAFAQCTLDMMIDQGTDYEFGLQLGSGRAANTLIGGIVGGLGQLAGNFSKLEGDSGLGEKGDKVFETVVPLVIGAGGRVVAVLASASIGSDE